MSDGIEYTAKELRAIADEIDLQHMHGQIGRPTLLRMAADVIEAQVATIAELRAENEKLRTEIAELNAVLHRTMNPPGVDR